MKSLKTIKKREVHAQSAMEYLLTYGWSILIIAIALVTLFELGYFNGTNSTLPSECIPQIGFLCNNLQLNSTGNLTLTVGNNGGQNLVITGLGCSNSSSTPTTFSPVLLTLGQDQSKQVTFECQLNSQNIGSSFKGSLWIKSNTGQIQQLGTTSAIVSTTSTISTSGNNGQGLLLIANEHGGSSNYGNVIEINANNLTLLMNIDFQSSPFNNPYGIALSPNNNLIYVVNHDGGSSGYGNVSIISTSNNQEISSISSSSIHYPYGIALSPIEPTAYLFNSGNILIANTLTNEVYNSITSPYIASPYSGSFSSNGIYLYVVDRNGGGSSQDGNILVINTQNNQIINTIDSSSFLHPTGIATSPTNNYLYVANDGGLAGTGNILVIDTSTNQVINSIDSSSLSGITDLSFSSNGVYLYALNEYPLFGNVITINTQDNQVVNAIASNSFNNPYGIVVSQNNAYLTSPTGGSYSSGNVIILNLQNSSTLNIGPQNASTFSYLSSQGETAYAIGNSKLYAINLISKQLTPINGSFDSPLSIVTNGKNLYVINEYGGGGFGNVIIMNSSTYTITGSISSSSFDYPQDITFSGNNGYITNRNGGSSQDGNILILNTSTNELTGGIDSSSFFYPSAVTFSNNKLYTLESPNKLLILNATTGALITSVTGIFNSPSHLITSGSNLYVTNSGSNNVIIINTINNQVTNSISENYLNSPTGITVI